MDIEKVIRAYLPEVIHLSLATTRDNKPWICEVHYAFDDNLNLYFRSLTTRRHSQDIALNPFVAGNIVKQHSLKEPPLGVYFEGNAKRLTPDQASRIALKKLQERFGLSNDILEESKRSDGHQFYKISVDKFYVFGNIDDTSFKKSELNWNGGKK